MSNHSISETIDRALAAAGLDTRHGSVKTVMETIRKALGRSGVERAVGAPVPPVDVPRRPVPSDPLDAARTAAPPREGRFLHDTYAGAAGTRDYKLYVPGSYRGEPMPLVVMLHGCQQDADDFAAGTRMNELAQTQGFLVAYPQQAANANGAHCWNWFVPQQQQRHGAEPSILAGVVERIGQDYRVDARRIYVAGLSAGAAMAVVLGVTYPDVFAAVGAHSGMPFGAAHDVGSALAAMRGRAPAASTVQAAQRRAGALPSGRSVPTIVFHGDGDQTVRASNGQAIVDQALADHARHDGTPLTTQVIEQLSAQGRDCTSTVYLDDSGRPHVEHWVLHGGSHAWSGGSSQGSYADELGPDASAQMVRFFLSQRRDACADR